MIRQKKLHAPIALLLLLVPFTTAISGEIEGARKDHRPAAEIRPQLEPVAQRYPAQFLAAVYSLPETRDVFFSLIGEDPTDPWQYRAIESFNLHTSPIQKRAVIHNVARMLEEVPRAECDRVIDGIRGWCEADRILHLSGAGFEALFSAGATAHLMEKVRPRVDYDPTPESLAAKLDPDERLSLYKDVLTEVASLDRSGRMQFFADVFAYMANHPRNWGN